MNTLTIRDLARSHDLDRLALSAIRGGSGYGYTPSCLPSYCAPQPVCGVPQPYAAPATLSFDAAQSLCQSQNTVNNNGNNAAYVCGITSTVNPSQCGSNNITFG